MAPMRRWLATAFLGVLLAPLLSAQEPRNNQDSRNGRHQAAATSRPAAPEPRLPIRVGIIGASVSGGFVDVTDVGASPPNASFPLKKVLQAAWRDRDIHIRDTTMGLGPLMFLRPVRYGERQIALLKRTKPQLVIGVDFIFWFGYGPHGFGQTGQRRRLDLQQKGLALLEQLDAKLLLGDYPDMAGAAVRMLPPHLVPRPETQKKLNERLYAWAKKRSGVLVFPLSAFAADAKNKTQVLAYGDRDLSLPRLYLLQSDRLHATRLGMVVLVHRLGGEFEKLLGQDHPLVRSDFSLPTLVQRLGIDEELPPR